jgi:hypothetical protein
MCHPCPASSIWTHWQTTRVVRIDRLVRSGGPNIREPPFNVPKTPAGFHVAVSVDVPIATHSMTDPRRFASSRPASVVEPSTIQTKADLLALTSLETRGDRTRSLRRFRRFDQPCKVDRYAIRYMRSLGQTSGQRAARQSLRSRDAQFGEPSTRSASVGLLARSDETEVRPPAH